jgi:hypothetical protein
MDAANGPDRVQQLHEQSAPVREQLFAAADMLVTFKLFDAKRVADLHAGTGYKDTAADFVQLVRMFREVWPAIQHKTPITEADLDEAERLGSALMKATSRKDAGSEGPAVEAAAIRQRAYTLFVNDYDQVRRAITFLRWSEDDVETIAPSIFQRSGSGSARKTGDAAHAPVATPTPAVAASASPTAPQSSPFIPPAKGGGPFTS